MRNEETKSRGREITLTQEGCLEAKFYKNNVVVTSKYTIYNFIFRNLFEQFHRVPNIFFLVLFILQLMPYISSVEYLSTIIPLIFILSVTAIKDGYDDYRKHKNDRIINELEALVLNKRMENFENLKWKNIKVGDIIFIKENDIIPADILILSSSSEDGYCYVSTQHLDGEVNLKYKTCCQEFSYLKNDVKLLKKFEGIFEFEHPNENLDYFEGKSVGSQTMVSIDNLIMRGSKLKNVDWCVGFVIYAGHDTKPMQNAGKIHYKKTGIEKMLNLISFYIILGLLGLVIVSSTCSGVWNYFVGTPFKMYLPLPWFLHTFSNNIQITIMFFINIFSYFILYSNCVPISLYVSIEMVKLGQSLFINWDNKMVEGKIRTECQTTALAEDLGQIDHIFTDKTGTLTINIFKFRSCLVGEKLFFEDDDFNDDLCSLISKNSLKDILFFKVLALCHSVLVKNADKIEYKAQSPDEECFVMFAQKYGFVLKERTINIITIEVNGVTETYNILCTLDFTNARKKMSIIVEKDNIFYLLTKGADDVICPDCLMSADENAMVNSNLNILSSRGLRILCISYKEIEPEEFYEWYKEYQTACKILDGKRGERLENVYKKIEQGMTFLGMTGIEDKLQEGVGETLAKLASINIKVWMLTGDKMETAVNIAYSCGLFDNSLLEVFTISKKEEIRQCLRRIKQVLIQTGDSYHDCRKQILQGSYEGDIFFGLILSGNVASICMEECPEDFYELTIFCRNIICCRMIPLLKSDLVKFVNKFYKKITTLSIGDGANDVSMIKAANIGIGIYGREGNQAARNSDYSIPGFRHLQRLIFVHGRWSYVRITKFLYYFFFKNIAFASLNFWFIFFSGYSAQRAVTNNFITFYNLLFTSLPVLILGMLDQDVSAEESLNCPRLYRESLRKRHFNTKILIKCVLESFFTSLTIFFVSLLATWGQISIEGYNLNDLKIFYQFIMAYHFIVVTTKIFFVFKQWTIIHVVVILLSFTAYLFIMFMFTLDLTITVYKSLIFWVTGFVVMLIVFLPYLTRKTIRKFRKPTKITSDDRDLINKKRNLTFV